MEIFREFRFEAAHRLPHVGLTHKCAQLHGHSYRVEVRISGPIDTDMGWVVDFAEIDAAFASIQALLDHTLLNDVDGLHNPTSEMLAIWIWERLAARLPLAAITVWETPRAGCVYRGDASR